MERLTQAMLRPTPLLRSVHGWLEKFICDTREKQRVVGNRHKEEGGVVTQAEFDHKEKSAHVCPFVRDSIDSDNFWIEASDLTKNDVPKIVLRLAELIDEFVKTEPEFDPSAAETPAPHELSEKCFLLYFPNFEAQKSTGGMPSMDTVHAICKPRFMERGLALGQFYPGCEQKGIYSGPEFRPLVSPVPAFAIRYLAKHDDLFNPVGSSGRPLYERYFPAEN